ncbi:MAG: biotin transporter BioY [Xylanivirga thermophila]|jgi:biotin transport system substrate-specific component|uniref:biotin transporter BioY n=1 Tax=Xylanivirga thermophila TaxID=2496273 RepID=UPI00101BF1F1|nr:biotin transporter BioY [Xylanivirga thermophila]
MNSKTKDMILVSLFAALTAVGAFIKIPLPPVPFTLQVFFVIFSGLFLGSKLGFLSQIVYIALGLIGIPIFANGGGIQYIFNPAFGYLIGFAVAAFVVGKMTEKLPKPSFGKYFIASLVGLVISYVFGVSYLYIILKYVNRVSTSFSKVMMSGCIVFLPWDIVKMAAVSWIAKEVRIRIRIGSGQSA